MAHHFEVLRPEESGRGRRHAVRAGAPQPNGARAGRPADAQREIIKLIQRTFLLPELPKAPDAVAFCGVEEGAGCSWVCARSGEALAAQVPSRVCLVDANLTGPTLHQEFGITNENGLADALRDSKAMAGIAQRFGKTNLWLVPAGSVAQPGEGMLSPARLHAVFSELRAQFDYLLVDTPAMGSSSDGALLAQSCDGVILVLGSETTRRESARMAKESLDAARVPVLGVALNRRTFPIPEALYRRL